MQSCSKQLTRTAKCSRYQRLPSIDAGIIRNKKRYPAVCVNSHRMETQRYHCENATLQLRMLKCSLTATTRLLLQTPFSTKIEVCRYLDALVDCRLIAVHLQLTATRSRLRRHEMPIRASDKLQNKRSNAVRVS